MKNNINLLQNYIAENIVLPISDIITGQSVSKSLKYLRKSQYWSKDQIQLFQNDKLKSLIQHAYETVPYYRDLFNSLNLKPDDIQNKDDLKKIPILTKAIIKREGIDRFRSSGIPLSKTIKCSSSGSTGEPLFFLTTKEAYSMNIAAELRGWYWMGFRLGDRLIKLSQNPRKRMIKRLQDKMSNNLYLATNPLVDSNFAFILDEIEKYKPKVIRCYPDPLLFLARYRTNHSEYKYSPLAIVTTGNTLFPKDRIEIEEAFGCKIYDTYNCEGNPNVFECSTHICYHSTEEYGISDVIDESGKSIEKGIGRLISTDLWNLAHPFIRYDTQDFVEIDSDICSCGREHLKIIRILGRDNEVLEMDTGRKFIVHNFTGFFQTDLPELLKSIDQFQVVKQKDKVVFRLVVNKQFDQQVSSFIKEYWQKEMNCNVDIEVVDSMPLTINGKRRFIINE